jgi:hypothetical protein
MSRGIKWFRSGFLVAFVLFFVCALLVLVVCAVAHKGDGQLMVLFASFPSSALAQGVAEKLHGSLGLSYMAAGFWEALLGGFFGAIQYGVVVGLLGLLASTIFGMLHDIRGGNAG